MIDGCGGDISNSSGYRWDKVRGNFEKRKEEGFGGARLLRHPNKQLREGPTVSTLSIGYKIVIKLSTRSTPVFSLVFTGSSTDFFRRDLMHDRRRVINIDLDRTSRSQGPERRTAPTSTYRIPTFPFHRSYSIRCRGQPASQHFHCYVAFHVVRNGRRL